MNNQLKAKWHGGFALMQRLGQALMIPIVVLPAAGLMVAGGRALTDFSENQQSFAFHLGKVLYSSGLVIFEQLSLIFAVGVAIGFTGGAGIAGLAAVTGYFVFSSVLKAFSEFQNITPGINTGVLGGISVGLLVSFLYNRYHQVKLNPVLGFFSGKRLIPILAVLGSVVLALVFVLVWPPIQKGIHDFGVSVMDAYLGPSWYASIKRLLIPVGLHHVFYPSFLYEFGEFTTASGQVVRGEATRYFAGDTTAGRFMASEFPIMIFGLPAAALAMVMRARPERRKAVAGMMLSAALTSIITGITEPVEFAFTFVAPLLYLVHAGLTFVSGILTTLLDIHLGYTFSASAIDLGLGYFNQKNISKFFLIVGPVMGLLYFSTFYWAIGFFNFKTPGREDEGTDEETGAGGEEMKNSGVTASSDPLKKEKAAAVLAAIGGAENIKTIDACITRLRLMLVDDTKINQPALKKWGASGVMKAGGGNVQIVFGVESDFLKAEIKALMANQKPINAVSSPLVGTVVALNQIPDETFSQEILGKTIAILPSGNQVVAPFSGTVNTVFRTQHAVGLTSDSGVEVLIHVGIDTVKMEGRGFRAKVKDGDRVVAGQVLIEYDLALIQSEAKSLVTPIVITNSSDFPGLTIAVVPGAKIKNGDRLWK